MKLLLGLFGLALITAALAAPTRDSEEVAVEPEVEATTEKQTQRNIKEEVSFETLLISQYNCISENVLC